MTYGPDKIKSTHLEFFNFKYENTLRVCRTFTRKCWKYNFIYLGDLIFRN